MMRGPLPQSIGNGMVELNPGVGILFGSRGAVRAEESPGMEAQACGSFTIDALPFRLAGRGIKRLKPSSRIWE